MAGRHAAKEPASKKAVFIIVTVIAVLAVIGAGTFFVFKNFIMKDSNNSGTTTAPVTTVGNETVEPQNSETEDTEETEEETENWDDQETTDLPDNEPTTEAPAETNETQQETTLDINIPTEEGSDITHFNASYVPNGEVIDLSTGESATLHDVFGSTYPGGALTFNEDGTFTDTIGGSGVDSGEYNVENSEIKATYAYDRNMDITVTSWNDDNTPAAFYITYGSDGNGYRVFFSGN